MRGFRSNPRNSRTSDAFRGRRRTDNGGRGGFSHGFRGRRITDNRTNGYRGGFSNSESPIQQRSYRAVVENPNNLQVTRLGLQQCIGILLKITSDNDSINIMLTNGELLNLLNNASHLNREQIYQLLSSLNQFYENENSPKSIRDIFILVLNSNFISSSLEPIIRDYFRAIPAENELKITINFFINCLKMLPKQFLEKMGLLFPSLMFTSNQFSSVVVKTLFKKLNDGLDVAKKMCEDERLLSSTLKKVALTDSSGFRDLAVIPQSSDIFCLNDEVNLRVNKVGGENQNQEAKYASVDEYLETQFGLLKEDFVRPLREGIASIREDLLTKPKLETRKLQIRVYEKVIVGDMYTSRNGLVYKVTFDVTKFKRIDWKKARRFIHGSLLCFTNNFFETIYFATVMEGDPKNLEKGIVVVQFHDDPIDKVLGNNEFMMIETKNLFEAYRHVLTKLQTFTEEILPFKDYIVFGRNDHSPPAYMSSTNLREISARGRLDQELDESQRLAFENALKSSLSLIQGPPGTGKTYVGLKIIKYLANHFQTNTNNIGPILVVCYTNHALDQFLCDIIEAIGIDFVIRVGGRSKMDVMKDCNISSIKHKWIRKRAFPANLYRRGIQNRLDIECAESSLIRKYVKIKNYNKGLLSYSDLHCCLTYSESLYFQRVNFDNWIKGGDAILGNNLERYSNRKQNIINDQCTLCIADVVHTGVLEIVRGIFREIERENVPEYENDDLLVEDPDDVLENERFLDEDVENLQQGNRFQNLYDDLENDDVDDGTDEDGFKCVANMKLIKNRLSKTKPLTEEEYAEIASLDVDFDLRLKLYKYWQEKYRIILLEEYRIEKEKFNIVSQERQDIYNEEYIAIMRSMKVIGMTTTGAARYGSILDQVGCQVVVIEEAAEVMEAHVVCSLSPNCQQLIMIGDHKQLRPKVDVYDLEINYNLGISLFERLIANKCQFFTLGYQHRMRPEISVCVKPIYPALKDSDVVFHYPSVSGMNKDIYFFNHDALENSSNETSYKNDFEAEFVANLCEYLINNGNLPQTITVLTLYSGQLYNINSRMRHQKFKGIRICVIDNFQGEENEIIILSFVRSNFNDTVGFVTSENRLCVTLSRAKRGFYAIGNFDMICRRSRLLDAIISQHLAKDCFGGKLPLQCLMHPDQENYFIEDVTDFKRDGCPSKCGVILKCGHNCMMTCHIKIPSHKQYKCAVPCEKMCARTLHNCKLLCHQRCSCNEKINIMLPCGHDKDIICRQTDLKCTKACTRELFCGHRCNKMCHELCNCEVKIVNVLKCGHNMAVECGTDVSKVNCVSVCDKELECGHRCAEICLRECVCKQMVEYTMPCSHKKRLPCGTDISQQFCKVLVEREFQCGHTAKFECFKNIVKCTTRKKRKLLCGHDAAVLCGDSVDGVICEKICDVKLPCPHKCSGKCGECYQDRFHVECKKLCRKFLKCRHYCERICHSGFCPPCEKPCVKYCEHSKCVSVCGQPCDCERCKVQCTKQLVCLTCKEKKECSNRCGENCSKICRDCWLQKGVDNSMFFIMDPCNCSILKTEFRPKAQTNGTEIFLLCQKCLKYLRTPYGGTFLLYFKQVLSVLFQPIEQDELLKWVTLFENFKAANYLPVNYKKIIDTLTKVKICKADLNNLSISFKHYSQLLLICNDLSKSGNQVTVGNYRKGLDATLTHLLRFLDPFVRNYIEVECALINLETSKVGLSTEIILLLNTMSVTDFALVHKQWFAILEEIGNITEKKNLKELRLKVDELKKNLNNTKESSEEEERLVGRIISAKDIYKEFALETLSVEDKIKEIKNLIRRCHPDKNGSARAKEAVQRLLEKKDLLKKQ